MHNFEEIKKEFQENESKTDGWKIMAKVTDIIRDIGANFLEMDGAALADAQSKLAGYKFFLADYISDLNRLSEEYKLQIKTTKASKWDEVTEEIKAKDGRVKNKEQIDNVILLMTQETHYLQILHETLYYQYKLKISSIDSILTAITQRISELKKQMTQV